MNRSVVCPCEGVIEKIFVNHASRVYEWEPMFVIRNGQGNKEKVTLGVSGEISELLVKENDHVKDGFILASLKEDDFVTGSD
ncbi:MAG: biotin/lipoyl-binding protein [Anaerobacillus sp.]